MIREACNDDQGMNEATATARSDTMKTIPNYIAFIIIMILANVILILGIGTGAEIRAHAPGWHCWVTLLAGAIIWWCARHAERDA